MVPSFSLFFLLAILYISFTEAVNPVVPWLSLEATTDPTKVQLKSRGSTGTEKQELDATLDPEVLNFKRILFNRITGETKVDLKVTSGTFPSLSVKTGFAGQLVLSVSSSTPSANCASFNPDSPRSFYVYTAEAASESNRIFTFTMPGTPAQQYTLKIVGTPLFQGYSLSLFDPKNKMDILGWNFPGCTHDFSWKEPSFELNDVVIFKVFKPTDKEGRLLAFHFTKDGCSFSSLDHIPVADLQAYDPRSWDMKLIYSVHKATSLSYSVLNGTAKTILFIAAALLARIIYRKVFIDVGDMEEEEEDEEERAFRLRQEEEQNKKNKKIFVKRRKRNPNNPPHGEEGHEHQEQDEGNNNNNNETGAPTDDAAQKEEALFNGGDGGQDGEAAPTAGPEETAMQEGEEDFFDVTSTHANHADNDLEDDGDFFNKSDDALNHYSSPKRKSKSDTVTVALGLSLAMLLVL